MALTIKQGFGLPKKELAIFDGDPLEYWNFIKSFETSIVSNVAGESEKLMYVLSVHTRFSEGHDQMLFVQGSFPRISNCEKAT